MAGSIWLIQRELGRDSYGDRYECAIDEGLGFFATREAAEARCARLVEGLTTRYNAYLATHAREAATEQRAYERRLGDYTVLRDAGRQAARPKAPAPKEPMTYAHWLRALRLPTYTPVEVQPGIEED